MNKFPSWSSTVLLILFTVKLVGYAAAEEDHQSNTCDQPVLMVVSGTTTDAAQMRRYGEALMASGIYSKTSGYYLHVGQPIDVFEGEYPTNGFTVIARFPCHAHARAFWYSEIYQKIIPLREGGANVLVRVYSELDPPTYMLDRLMGGKFGNIPSIEDIEQLDPER